jgi:hypothetical protein
VSFERIFAFSSLTIPNLRGFIETSRHNKVSEWIIEGHRINDILVLLQRELFIACFCVPDFASPIIRACDKFGSIFIESAVRQWKQMCAKCFKQFKVMLSLSLLSNQAFDQLLELGFS